MKKLWLWVGLFVVLGMLSPHEGMAAESKAKPVITQPKAKKVTKPAKKAPGKKAAPSPLASPAVWAAVKAPSKDTPQAVGGYAQGCIAGAVPLQPLEGDGYQVLRTARNRYYGHPALIAYIKKLAKQTRQASLPGFLIGDMSQPRGGPMAFGHASHQIGLDVDIWFLLTTKPLPKAEREHPRPISLVDSHNRAIDPANWTSNHARLLRIAASFPEVERIFVNPVIKRVLCETERGDRRWLVKLRPWRGHDEHFHVRLRCPPGSPKCAAQTPIAAGDEGCGEELDSWLDSTRPLTFDDSETTAISAPKLPGKPAPKPVRSPPPPECQNILRGK